MQIFLGPQTNGVRNTAFNDNFNQKGAGILLENISRTTRVKEKIPSKNLQFKV